MILSPDEDLYYNCNHRDFIRDLTNLQWCLRKSNELLKTSHTWLPSVAYWLLLVTEKTEIYLEVTFDHRYWFNIT